MTISKVISAEKKPKVQDDPFIYIKISLKLI